MQARLVETFSGEAIQEAIHSLGSGGGLVLLLPGRYTIRRTLLLPSNLVLRGSGADSSVLVLHEGANCHVMRNADPEDGNANIRIEHLGIDGNRTGQRRPAEVQSITFCCAMYLKKVTGLAVEAVSTTSVYQTGLHCNGCSRVRVHRFRAESVGWSGISTSGTDDIVVTDAVVTNAGLDVMHSGIHLDGGSGAYLEASVDTCTGNAVMIDSAYAPMENVVIRCTGKWSKRGVALSGGPEHPISNVLIGGEYSENDEVGVLLSNASHVFVDRCSIRSNGQYGILLQGRRGAVGCCVSNCTIAQNAVPIAEIHASRDNYFVNNTLVGNESEPQYSRARPRGERGAGASLSGPAAAAPAPRAAPAPAPSTWRGANRCSVCGNASEFEPDGRPIRESYRCAHCKASLRYRAQADLLLRLYARRGSTCIRDLAAEPEFARLDIYEPGVLGPFRSLFRDLKGYTVSDYWPDVPAGEWKSGVQCQDLMALTYPSESFDLVVTSDIFEHVRKPLAGFAEIARVLRPGGKHVFSIPVLDPMPERTVYRVDTSGAEDVHVLEARYHLGPGNSRHIVYTDFGADFLEELRGIGLETHAVAFDSPDPAMRSVLSFYSVKV